MTNIVMKDLLIRTELVTKCSAGHSNDIYFIVQPTFHLYIYRYRGNELNSWTTWKD